MIRSNSLVAFILSTLILTNQISAASKSNIPDVSIEVTVRQKEGGSVGKGLHLAHLLCWQGNCSLTWLSLNQCGPAGSGKDAFYPKVERFSTQEGNLQVTTLGDALQVKQVAPEVITTLRIGYETTPSVSLSTKVTSFSGGFVKNSAILQKVITVEYVPLIGSFSEIKLDCAALLPGIETRN